MNQKILKLGFLSIVLIVIISIISSTILYDNSLLQVYNDGASVGSVSVKIDYYDGTEGPTGNFDIEAPIIQTTNQELTIQGVDLVRAAAKYLGRAYDGSSGGVGGWKQPNPTNGNIDCSGLVQCALWDNGISISGLCMRTLTVPRAVQNWLEYGEAADSGSAPDMLFSEVCTYYLNTKGTADRGDDLVDISYSNPDGESIATRAENITFTKDGVTKKINILKIANPIADNLRWYQYFDADGEIKTLPAGTIVCSYAGQGTSLNPVGSDHMWMSIGDLGTANVDEARSKLKEMGVLPEDGSKDNFVYADNDTSTYWMIESSPKQKVNGVQINNYDPNQNEATGKKATGTIWAFQIGKDVVPEGNFSIKLVKYEDGTDVELPNATFKVEIPGLEYTDTQTTGPGGIANFKNADIKEEGTYDVIVTEVESPDGYIGITEPIKFQVTTQLVGDDTYKLVPDHDIVLDNARKIDVNEGEILIEAENRTTSIDIHKGVKTVENQDSGYYAVAKAIEEAEKNQAEQDENVDPSYEDETTGNEYTEEELKDIAHEWVVETTIPEDVKTYNRYMVTDPVDTTKLEFSGLDRVKVELIDSTGNVTKTLVKGTDYEAVYENDILSVTYIDKKDGKDFYGEFLSTATTSDKIRLTFNTTFKVNPETGKLVVLEGTVTNAENKATLKYDNGSGEDREKDSEEPEVHTGAVSIFKYEDTNGNGKHDEGEKALVGAEFKIALSEEDAKNGKFVKIGGKELVAISNKDGIATFTGLSFGGDAKDDEENLKNGLYGYDWETASRDYYIVETKTPAGYEKITDVLKVTVSKDSSEKIDITDKIDELDSIGNKPLTFDLALRKWVTHAFVTENGQTVEYKTGHKAEDDPEAVVKVDLKKSKLNEVTVKFKYSIRITNEGQIAGEAREITDYIPAGLKFVQEDNPDWTTTSDERIVKTRKLEGVTLKPDESAEVEIMLTWVNSKDSMGVMTNTAEISEDYNEYGVHDIDSTPNNKKPKEDDIDDAPVMLAIKTGSEIIGYTSIGLGFVTIVTAGVLMIKRKFTNV